ncbi:PelD GGDEF domain-containing protein [Acidiferrobacter sp.]|uniref:PelD GGDEF domain-containing protein n=1 Tax=Acidiferrobacter sp. TaxID=1872107 RepID=UPI0026184F0E|nr:PelD GGDEF domain-containing protein [Acidiferrobacter sp.]
MSVGTHLAPSRQARVWAEAVAIPVIAIAVAFVASPHDPFLVNATFPWLWFAPVLVALRYGLAPAVLSLAILVVSFVAARLGLPALHIHGLPEGQFLGGIMLTLLAGEYGSMWILRLRRSEQMSAYATQQLEGLTRTLHMTRLSHDRLEQTIIGKPVTLRDSLREIRHDLVAHAGMLDGELAARLLHLTAYHGGFEQAALHAVSDDRINPQPLAHIGAAFPLDDTDILITRCLEKRRTAYWAANSLKNGERSAYLVVAPLLTSDDTLLGVLVVATMPFLFLQDENLLTVSILLAYVADDAYAARRAEDILRALPQCPPRFAAETVKLARSARDLDLESSLVAVTITVADRPLRDAIVEDIATAARALDDTWRMTGDASARIVTLLPFGKRAVAEGYVQRLQARLAEKFGLASADTTFTAAIYGIGSGDVLPVLSAAAGVSP